LNIKLRDNETLRQALSRLRKEVKAGETTLEIDEVKDVVEALSSEDPKTRKNAALLLADLANLDVLSDFFKERAREILDTLVSTYVKEDTLFVRSSILEGVKAYLDETKFDISKSVESIISKLEERLSEIDGEEHE
jgi:molybdopterin converting factor small subunit